MEKITPDSVFDAVATLVRKGKSSEENCAMIYIMEGFSPFE